MLPLNSHFLQVLGNGSLHGWIGALVETHNSPCYQFLFFFLSEARTPVINVSPGKTIKLHQPVRSQTLFREWQFGKEFWIGWVMWLSFQEL